MAPPQASHGLHRKCKKSSCLKQQGLKLLYLVFSITYWTSTKFAQIIPLGRKMAPPRVQMFYIGLYGETVKKSSCLKPEGLDYW